jgi:hypothetical protein
MPHLVVSLRGRRLNLSCEEAGNGVIITLNPARLEVQMGMFDKFPKPPTPKPPVMKPPAINPASGLPMVGRGIGGFDTGGNIWGTKRNSLIRRLNLFGRQK